jgi:hypothetical protein
MMQNLVLTVYFSMILLSAICAVFVMASASSRMMSLNPAAAPPPPGFEVGATEKICFVEAKVLICSRTTSMPRSSEALSSRTIWRMLSWP